MDDDMDFMAVFATGKHRPKHKSHGAGASAPESEGVRLNPTQRKINSSRRKHEGAVKTLVKRNELVRSLVLDGLEAAAQAVKHAEEVDAEGSSSELGTPLAEANMASLREAYQQTSSLEKVYQQSSSTEKPGVGEKEVLKGWQLVCAIASMVIASDSTEEERESAYRAQMTANVHMAAIHRHNGQIRQAIKLNEEVLALAMKVKKDAATAAAISSVLHQLSALHSSIGSMEKSKKYMQMAENVRQKLSGGAVPSGRTEAAPAAAEMPEKGVNRTSPPPSAPLPTPPLSSSSEDTATAATTTTAALEGVTFATLFPEFDAADVSPSAVASRAMRAAMFDQNFDLLVSLLNKALLGKGDATEALKYRVPALGISFLMSAAAADRPDVIRRLLAQYPASYVASAIIKEVDHAGNNAVVHAANVGQVRALDELLRGLYNGNPELKTLAPLPAVAMIPERLPLVGITSKQLDGFDSKTKSQLSLFVAHPARYISEFKAPILGAAPAAASIHHMHPHVHAPPSSWNPALSPAATAWLVSSLAAVSLHGTAQTSAASSTAAPTSADIARNKATAKVPEEGKKGSWAERAKAPAPPSATDKKSKKPNKRGGESTTSGPVYTNISKEAGAGKLVGRKLEAFVPDASIPETGGLDDEAAGWDQFAANEALFGVKAGFKEELYTSQLDMTKFTPEQIAKAEAIAKTIETDASELSNPHVKEERTGAVADDIDEETRFSAVDRRARKHGAGVDSFIDAAVGKGDASIFFEPKR